MDAFESTRLQAVIRTAVEWWAGARYVCGAHEDRDGVFVHDLTFESRTGWFRVTITPIEKRRH